MPVDTRNRSFHFATPPRRVVSLVPSITETLFDLGAGETVVGITSFCIFPTDRVATIPRVGGTKNPDIDAIRALAPDLVHMNLEENLQRDAREIETFAPVFVSEPRSVSDVINLLEVLGALHGRESSAIEWTARITNEAGLVSSKPFTFTCAIWKDPWMWCGGDTYVSGLVETSGGRNVLRDRRRYPKLGLDAITELNPDVIFLPDEPYAFIDHDAKEMASLTGARVIGPFPGHLFTWHGTRTLEGLKFLRSLQSQI